MAKLLFDFDPILFAASAVGEKRSIKAVHRQSGDEYDFDTRTEFWGHHKAKAGGWLSEYNAGKTSPRLPEEFEIVDIQTPEPLENCMFILDNMVKGYCERLGSKNYYGYSGTGEVFRHDLATILEYKGNRKGLTRPVHLAALKEHVVKKHNCTIVERVEPDDACSIDSYAAYQKWKKTRNDADKLILVMAEKDYLQCAGHLYNTNNGGDVCSYEGFGWLELNEKGNVKGRGRMWLAHQTLSNDVADNYAANSASSLKWAEKSSYKLLNGCKNDKEMFEALVKGYKTLYPCKKVVKGWRGEDIEIDWLYMLQENFNLAKLLRTREEKPTDVKAVLDKLGVET
jgi:hypothetical protein